MQVLFITGHIMIYNYDFALDIIYINTSILILKNHFCRFEFRDLNIIDFLMRTKV